MQIFKHQQFGEIRATVIDGEPWFSGKDAAASLGYSNTRDALTKHVDAEDKNTVAKRDGIAGNPNMTFINESGLYSLILASKLPAAKSFKRWVTSEVLPSIRKHGAYLTPQVQNQILNNPDFLISLANKIKEEQAKNRALAEENQRMKPKALFAEAVSVSNSEILIGALAKLLKQNGVEIGRNRLFAVLRRYGYLIRDNTKEKNLPSQKSMEMGLFRVKETTIHANGEVLISCTPYVTGKGQLYFMDRFLSGAIKI